MANVTVILDTAFVDEPQEFAEIIDRMPAGLRQKPIEDLLLAGIKTAWTNCEFEFRSGDWHGLLLSYAGGRVHGRWIEYERTLDDFCNDVERYQKNLGDYYSMISHYVNGIDWASPEADLPVPKCVADYFNGSVRSDYIKIYATDPALDYDD